MSYCVEPDYTWPIKIASYDAGRDKRLRLSNQLKLQQEAGERHLGAGGLTWEELCHHGMVFVLTRLNSVIHRAPLLDEKIWLRTWHRGTRGAQFYRCYQFLDETGKPLIESVSAFALVDPATHKLLRPDAFDQFGMALQPDRKNGCPDPGRLRPPTALVPAGTRRVYWSDTDYNGHLNNTVYADILCDFLPGGMEGRRITGFSIAFLKEAMEGEELAVSACSVSGEAWVSATHERGTCFEARATFAEE